MPGIIHNLDDDRAIANLILVLIIGIVLTFPLRWWVGYMATVRQRSAILWSCLCYVLGPFAFAVMFLAPKPTGTVVDHPARWALLCEVLCTVIACLVVFVGIGVYYVAGR